MFFLNLFSPLAASASPIGAVTGGPLSDEWRGETPDLFTIDGKPALEAARGDESRNRAPEENEVKEWIRSEEDKVRALGRPMSTEEANRLAGVYKAERMLRELRALEGAVRRWDVIHLCRSVEAKLFQAAKTGDSRGIAEGQRAMEKIGAYAKAEKRMFGVMRGLASQYPAGSRFLLELDLSKDNPKVAPYLSLKDNTGPEKKMSPWEPSIETLRQLDIVRLYGELKESSSPDRAQSAHAVKKAIDEFVRDAALFSDSWANVAGRLGLEPISADKLDERTRHLRDVYASPGIARFFDLLGKRSDEQIKSNEGFRTRVAFGRAASALEEIGILNAALSRPYGEVAGKLDAAMLDDTRKFFVSRVGEYLAFLGKDGNTAKIREVRQTLDRLRGLKIDGTNLREPFEGLGRLAAEVSLREAGHCEGLLRKLIAQAEAIPPRKGNLDLLKKDLSGIGEDPGRRLKAYREIEAKIRSAVALRLVDASIEQYETFQDEAVLSEGLATAIGLLNPLSFKRWAVRAGEAIHRRSIPSLRLNQEILNRLHDVRARLDSGDPKIEARGLKEFQALQEAGVHRMLAAKFEGDATFNGYTIGLGIIIASAALAGAAATAVAPFVEGMAAGALAIYGVEGTVFTLSHRLLDAAARGRPGGEFTRMAGNPLGLAGECALNAGMFAYIGKAMKLYEGFFNKGIEAVARRTVAKEIAISAGGFVFETAAFQTWQFYVSVGRGVARGLPDPIREAAKQSFSPASFLHGAAFLLALKCGHHLSRPLFDPILQKAERFAMGIKFAKDWKAVQGEAAAIYGDLQSFYFEGKGELGAIMGRYQEALGKKWELLGRVPEEFRNDAWRDQVRENRDAFREIEGFKCLVVEMPRIVGPKNGFGVRSLSDSGNGVFSYAPRSREPFLKALKALEDTEVKVLGETIVATFRLPGGFEVSRVFIPKPDWKALPQAPQPASPARAKTASDPYEQAYADAAE